MNRPMPEAVDAAENIMARAGRTFHLASRLLPARMRGDAAMLYAFCRRMDDIADGDATNGERDLTEVVRLLREAPRSDNAEKAGWPVVLEQRYPGISQIAAELTHALACDTGPRRIADAAELDAYAYGVAGTVGLMMCRILDAPPEGAQAARDLGMAMQLTNISRDVCEDLERDRVYVPAEWVHPEAVRAAVRGEQPEMLAQALLQLLEAADRLYASADRGMGYLPWRPRIAILAAASCYREIGVIVRRDPQGSWQRRSVVPTSRKVWLVLRAMVRSLFYRRPRHTVRDTPVDAWRARAAEGEERA
jgi:phytoene synthase